MTTSNQDLLNSLISQPSWTPPPVAGGADGAVPPPPNPPKKKKDPMSAGDFFRIVAGLLITGLITFGVFLAYVVFNPAQAQIFVQLGVNPGDLAKLLQKLVFFVFLFLVAGESLAFIVCLFKGIITKKEFKKKKALFLVLSGFLFVIAMGTMTAWAVLNQKIGAADFANPNGGILIYDNDWLGSTELKEYAQMNSFENLIGPVTLKFDLSSDVNFVSRTFDINRYEFDCGNGKGLVSGADAAGAEIICTYESASTFEPSGKYIGRDRTIRGNPQGEYKMRNLPVVVVRGVVRRSVALRRNRAVHTFDASSLVSVAPGGRISWEVDGTDQKGVEPRFIVLAEDREKIVCLRVFSTNDVCDRYFIVAPGDGQSSNGGGTVTYERDPDNSRTMIFTLSGVTIDGDDELVDAIWTIDESDVCASNPDLPETCRYTFFSNDNQQHSIRFRASTVTSQKKYDIRETFMLYAPVVLDGTAQWLPLLKVTDTEEKLPIDLVQRSRDILVDGVRAPRTLSFDAREVRVSDATYVLSDVAWDFDGDGQSDKKGLTADYEFSLSKRYETIIRYTFVSERRKDRQIKEQKIIVNAEKPDLAPVMKIDMDSDYAPSEIRFDGSESEAKESEIVKFTWDFGDGSSPVIGDAIQRRVYENAGSYTIKLTVTRKDGVSASTTRRLEIKPAALKIMITSSVAVGKVDFPVDFSSLGSNGQIKSYEWDFGDGQKSFDPNPNHTYGSPGEYEVSLSVTYDDNRRNTQTKKFTVEP